MGKSRDKKPPWGGLTGGPGLMGGGLLPELFSQVVQPLQPADLCEQPFFIALLCLLQALPGTGYVLGEDTTHTAHATVHSKPMG